MRILFVTEFSPSAQKVFTGGVEARTFFTVHHLRQRHSVKIISRQQSAVVATLGSVMARAWFMLRAIFRGAQLGQIDIVEGSNVVCYLPAWIIARLHHARAVAWVPDVLGANWRYLGLAGIFGRLLELISLRLPWDHFLALSHHTAQKLYHLGINPARVTVIYPGVSRQEFSLPVSKRHLPTLCVIARLVAYKHVDQVVTLVHKLKASLPDIRLLVIGAGPQASAIRRQVNQLDLASQVYFKANLPRSALIKQLKSCHLLVHFSTVEGFGLVILEALAAGLPYLAYDTPLNQEITHNGQGGILISLGDLDQAAVVAQKLLVDPLMSHRLRISGNSLLRYYSWTESARHTESVYTALLKK